jgi:hypothetical protein
VLPSRIEAGPRDSSCACSTAIATTRRARVRSRERGSRSSSPPSELPRRVLPRNRGPSTWVPHPEPS